MANKNLPKLGAKKVKAPKVENKPKQKSGDCGKIVPPDSLWINLYRWAYNSGRITGHIVAGPLKGRPDHCIVKYLRADITPPSASEEGRMKRRAAWAEKYLAAFCRKVISIPHPAYKFQIEIVQEDAKRFLKELHRRSTRAKAGGKRDR